MNTRRSLAPVAALTLLAVPLASCSGTADAGGGDEGRGDGLEVLASMYPLDFVASEVGGEHVTVSSVTPAGVDPHDLELSPATVAQFDNATIVYLSGFQAALDDALEVTSPEHALDVAEAAGVHGVEGQGERAGQEAAGHAEGGHEEEGHAEDGHEEEGHAEDGHEHAGHEHEAGDPHFWLDPNRVADVADAVSAELSDVDPEHAEEYRANAEELRGELEKLDADFAAGLEQCEIRTIVTAHEAYGYLAEAYDLEQVGLSGLDPEAEPSPARLAEITEVVEGSGVSTIFTESLVNPAVAESLANDLGVDVALLDPVETAPEGGGDYVDAMRANLDALTSALRCS
ncbi:metal ABC transporter substrate-binding protein [Georgenia halophila]|uniref:Metal ABC transporter substrate-binding protein n=1 Tax=Georgenia halophila TaxID=620889 RepID=A0ABP8LPI4_9MICO